MTELNYLKRVGEQFSPKGILCPYCVKYEMLEQELCAFGDMENRIFCPHCDYHFELKAVSPESNLKQ